MENNWIKDGNLFIPNNEQPIEPTPWTLNINMGDWSPHKVTPEELAKNHAEYERVFHVVEVLTKIHNLLAENGLKLYQYEGDGDCYTPSISIGNYNTEINNETGLFYLPDLPDKWDENTIVQKQSSFMLPHCSVIYHCAVIPQPPTND